MKKMTFILMIMAACLASAAFAVAPADITNASFEDDTIAAGIADYWTLWGENQSGLVYHFGDAVNANTGNDYFEISLGGGGWAGIHPDLGQEVGVTAGSEVEFVAWAKTADGAEATGAVALKFEWYATHGEGWVEGQDFDELYLDLTGTWTQMRCALLALQRQKPSSSIPP